jgi:hypothetical protein
MKLTITIGALIGLLVALLVAGFLALACSMPANAQTPALEKLYCVPEASLADVLNKASDIPVKNGGIYNAIQQAVNAIATDGAAKFKALQDQHAADQKTIDGLKKQVAEDAAREKVAKEDIGAAKATIATLQAEHPTPAASVPIKPAEAPKK